jgi:tetratricopeptide (TPR) repeat protein
MEDATRAAQEATQASDPVIRARGMVAEADIFALDSTMRAEEARTRRDEAHAVLEAADDHLGLAHYWRSRGYDFWADCRCAESGEAWARGIEHARAVGAERLEWELRSYALSGLVLGGTPVSVALPIVRAALAEAREGSLEEAATQRALAQLLAYSGSIEEARALVAQGVQTFRDAGLLVTAAGWSMSQSEIERRAGDGDAQVRVLRAAHDELERLGDRFFFGTVALSLAGALVDHGGDEKEIEALCSAARERTIPGDLANYIWLDWVESRLLAIRGRLDEAEARARHGLEASEETDHFLMRARSRLALAEVLHRAGRQDQAHAIASEAIAVHEAKEDVTGAAWWRRYLADAGIPVS